MKNFKGIGASEGISIGKAMLFLEEEMIVPQDKIGEAQVGTEIEKLLDAQKKSKTQHFLLNYSVPINSFVKRCAVGVIARPPSAVSLKIAGICRPT